MNFVKIGTRWLTRLVLLGFLALIVGALTVLVVIPRATQGTALTVLTGSMTPAIPVGSTVVVRVVDPGTLHIGDIGTYQRAPGVNEYITHRIVAIDTTTSPVNFTFKGDANRGPDITPVPAGAIRGKVWFHVPYLGSIKDGLSGGSGRVPLLGAATVGLAGFSLYQFFTVIRGRRRKAEGTDQPGLEMDFPTHAFGDVGPSFVADLLQGSCDEVDTATVRLTFSGSQERLDLLRELLARFGVPVADPEATESEPKSHGDTAEAEDVTPGDEPAAGLSPGLVEDEHRAVAHV